MSKNPSRLVNFSPNFTNSPETFIMHKHGSSKKGNKRVTPLSREQFYCPIQFLRRVGDKVVSALRFICTVKSSSNNHKVSSPSTGEFVRPRFQMADHSDTHRAQVVEDCIKFLNSYAS